MAKGPGHADDRGANFKYIWLEFNLPGLRSSAHLEWCPRIRVATMIDTRELDRLEYLAFKFGALTAPETRQALLTSVRLLKTPLPDTFLGRPIFEPRMEEDEAR